MSEENRNGENTVVTNDNMKTDIIETNSVDDITSATQQLAKEASEQPILWNPKGVGAIGILVNPLFGGAMLMMNWKAMGDEDAATKAILWSILFMLGTLFLPIPPMLSGVIWYFVSCRVQVNHVKQPDFEYIRRSWLWPLIIIAVLISIVGYIAYDIYSTYGIGAFS